MTDNRPAADREADRLAGLVHGESAPLERDQGAPATAEGEFAAGLSWPGAGRDPGGPAYELDPDVLAAQVPRGL